MKKLSIFCSLLLVCAILASCDGTTAVIPGNTAGSGAESSSSTNPPAASSEVTTLPDAQTTESPATTSPEAEPSAPETERPEIIYSCIDWYIEDPAYIAMFVLPRYFDACEEYHIPCMFCVVTFTDIDYTQIGDEYRTLPITVSIHKIFQKTSCTSLNEGDSITLQQSSCYWKKSEDAYIVSYCDYDFPIAEQGKRYLAIISEAENPTEEYPLGISAISVPLPEGDEIRDEYFEEWYQKLNLHELLVLFAPQALDEWFYPYLESE